MEESLASSVASELFQVWGEGWRNRLGWNWRMRRVEFHSSWFNLDFRFPRVSIGCKRIPEQPGSDLSSGLCVIGFSGCNVYEADLERQMRQCRRALEAQQEGTFCRSMWWEAAGG